VPAVLRAGNISSPAVSLVFDGRSTTVWEGT
jgi:hypothetical protein